jgi:hypothetical protein
MNGNFNIHSPAPLSRGESEEFIFLNLSDIFRLWMDIKYYEEKAVSRVRNIGHIEPVRTGGLNMTRYPKIDF